MKRTLKFAKIFKQTPLLKINTIKIGQRNIMITVGDEIDENNKNKRHQLVLEVPNSQLFIDHIQYINFISDYKTTEIDTENKDTTWAIAVSAIGLVIFNIPFGLLSIYPIVSGCTYIYKENTYINYRHMSDNDFKFKYEAELMKLKQ